MALSQRLIWMSPVKGHLGPSHCTRSSSRSSRSFREPLLPPQARRPETAGSRGNQWDWVAPADCKLGLGRGTFYIPGLLASPRGTCPRGGSVLGLRNSGSQLVRLNDWPFLSPPRTPHAHYS